MNERIVNIQVFDFNGAVLSEAEVLLMPLDADVERNIEFDFDEHWLSHRAYDVKPGAYMLHAVSDGLEPGEREVYVDEAGLEDTVFLGAEGMPFYYKGKVKVPFEPPAHLLAASFKAGASACEKENLFAYAVELGLEIEESGFSIREEGVVVFRVQAIDDEVTREAVRMLSDHPAIDRSGPVIHFDSGSISFLTNEFIVQFSAGVPDDEVPMIAQQYGFEVVRAFSYISNGFLLRALELPSYNLLQNAADLLAGGRVEFVEPNMVATGEIDSKPNDYLYANQEHHKTINSEKAWDITKGSKDIIIAVADWGCDLKHPDFQNKSSMAWKKLAGSFNFRTMTPDTKDDKHGTKSAGMAAAVSDNERGVAGLAPGCQLLPVRKGLRLSDIADMYVWAAGFDPKNSSPKFPKKLKRGADVISSSFSVMDKPMSAVMKAAFDFITTYGRNGKGCVVVFSVGNNAKDLAKLNAREWVKYERTIGVAYSTTKTPEKRGVTSNYGTSVDLCAPSEGITCTTTNIGEGSYIGYKNANSKDYDDFGQTSCACPQVSGLAALMLSVNPDLTWIEVRQILRDTAVKIDSSNNDVNGKWSAGFSKWYGYGRISAEAAVKAAKAYKPKWDIFVRDNINDKGTVPSTGRFSNTPDLWVRNNAPTIDKNSKPKSYNDLPPHQDPIAGQDNWIYVRYKNIGLQTSQKFYVRVYVANYPGYQYQYPDNFIPVNKSGTAITPSTMQPETYLIGETSDTGVVGNGWKIANVKWPSNLIPPKTITVNGKATKWSPCLLVEVTPHDGPKPSGNKIPDNNNLAQKNVTILYEKTDEDDSFEVTTIMGDPVNRSEYAVLLADTEMMPPAFRLYVEFSDDEVRARLREFEGDPQYNFSFGEHLGREVVWLGERGETRIPVFSNSRLTPVIVGGFREGYVEPGNYTLTLTQLEPSGRPTGEYSVEIRVQATQLLEKALSEVYKLPIERQDEIATLIIEKLKT